MVQVVIVVFLLHVFFLHVFFLTGLSGASPITIDELNRKIYVGDMDQYIDSNSGLTYEDFRHKRELFYKPSNNFQSAQNR